MMEREAFCPLNCTVRRWEGDRAHGPCSRLLFGTETRKNVSELCKRAAPSQLPLQTEQGGSGKGEGSHSWF